jgi:hypothetical protein
MPKQDKASFFVHKGETASERSKYKETHRNGKMAQEVCMQQDDVGSCKSVFVVAGDGGAYLGTDESWLACEWHVVSLRRVVL